MTPWIFITLVAAAVATSTVSAILGMGGGLVLQAVLMMALPLTVVIPLHAAVQLSSNVTRLAVYLKDMETRIVGRYCVGAVFGGVGGWFFLEQLRPKPGTPAERGLEAAIGIIILAATFLPQPNFERRLGDNVFVLVGAAGTCIGILVGAVGPFIAPFFVREGMFKERLIATKAACQAVTHVVKIPTFVLWGFDFRPHVGLLAAMIAAVVVGTLIGRRLLKYVPLKVFVTAVKVFLVLAAVKFIVGFE